MLWAQSSNCDVTHDIDYNIHDVTGVTAYARRIKSGTFDTEYAEITDFQALAAPSDENSSISTTIDDNWTNVVTHDYTISSSDSPLINAGTYLSSPSAVQTDKAGVSRSNPPEIGPYEYEEGNIRGVIF